MHPHEHAPQVAHRFPFGYPFLLVGSRTASRKILDYSGQMSTEHGSSTITVIGAERTTGNINFETPENTARVIIPAIIILIKNPNMIVSSFHSKQSYFSCYEKNTPCQCGCLRFQGGLGYSLIFEMRYDALDSGGICGGVL